MNAKDFRRIALSFDGAEEGSHMGHADFRVEGRIFATLASQDKGYGNLMLTPELQKAFVDELPEIFLPVAGAWERPTFIWPRRPRTCCTAPCKWRGS
jgi:hypothetical protein